MEREKAYVDSLGTSQPAYDFFTGRASGGTKIGYPWQWSDTVLITPNVGVYADYYFNKDNATLPLAALPINVLHGFSARVTSGLALSFTGGTQLSIGGELGGLGNDFKVWTARGRATVPF